VPGICQSPAGGTERDCRSEREPGSGCRRISSPAPPVLAARDGRLALWSDLRLFGDFQGVVDPRCRDTAQSTPASNARAATELHGGPLFAGRSTSPWCAGSSACRSRQDRVPVPQPRPSRSPCVGLLKLAGVQGSDRPTLEAATTGIHRRLVQPTTKEMRRRVGPDRPVGAFCGVPRVSSTNGMSLSSRQSRRRWAD